MFNDVLSRAQQHFPKLTIKYKDESLLMKILARILFFNKNFMSYVTTIGNTVYFSSAARIKNSPVSSTVVLLHEITHIYSESKSTSLFAFLYLFPQILSLLSIPVFILLGWKLAIICLLFLLPLPAYWRMVEERRAYIISLYVMNKIDDKINLGSHKDSFIEEFSSSSYYWMWYLPGIKSSFDSALLEIKKGSRPVYDKELYDMVDKILLG